MKISFNILLTLLSSLFYIQTYPANDYPLLVWVALVPLFIALNNNSYKINTFLTLIFSATVWLIYLWKPFYDAVFLISNKLFLASILTFLHLFLYMIPFIIMGLIYHKFKSYRILDAIYLASIFTFFSMYIPKLFTFNMAISLYNYPLLLQTVDISGVSILLWFIIIINLSIKNIIFLIIEKNIKKDFLLNIGMIISILFFVLGYGYFSLYSISKKEIKNKITIATIQPNMGHRLHQMSMIRDNKKSTPYSHIELTRKALSQNKKIDLIVWPEGGLIVDCDNKAILNKLSNFTKEIKIPLMYQCNKCKKEGSTNRCFNQSRYMGSGGEVESIYNKQNLIPLFEHIPKIAQKTFIEKEFHNELIFKKGEDNKIFVNTHSKIIPTLCYDAHSNKIIKKGLDLGGEILIIQSNDRIFKKSSIGLFDTAINIVSAISFRIPMVKSSNSGYGVFLSSSGEIIKGSMTPLSKRFTSIHTINIQKSFSLYRLYGDWFYLLLCLLSIYIILNKFIKR